MNEKRYCFRCKYAEAVDVFDPSDGVFKRGWKCNLTPSSPAILDFKIECRHSDEEFNEYEKDGFDIKMFLIKFFIAFFITLFFMAVVTVQIILLW